MINYIIKIIYLSMVVCENLAKEIAPMKNPWALIQCVLNVILPGFGTILNSCMAPKCNATSLIIGILQLVLAYSYNWMDLVYMVGMLILERSRDM